MYSYGLPVLSECSTMKDFPEVLTIRYIHGTFSVLMSEFLKLPGGWIKSYLKKVVSKAEYRDQIATLTKLYLFYTYNAKRLREALRAFPEHEEAETLRLNTEIAFNQAKLDTLRDLKKKARKRGSDGKYYYDSTAPADMELRRLSDLIKDYKSQIRALAADKKRMQKELSVCEGNVEIVRERLEAVSW